MELIDKKDRKVLNEGRNKGMGFAFVKKTGEDKFETVQPISACKDYLSDVVWSEATGQGITAYGLTYKKQNIFDEECAYICFSILPTQFSGPYPGFEGDKASLAENYKNIEVLMNAFEEKLNLPGRTVVEEAAPNLYIATIPIFWVKATYRISLWSLLVRMAQKWDGNGDAIKFIMEVYKGEDVYIFASAKKNVTAMLEGFCPEQNLEGIKGHYEVHNSGIMGYVFPKKVAV